MLELIREVTQWWIVLFILGLAVLPFTVGFFDIFFDKGYAFNKVIGIILVAYAAYLLGTLHILPFTSLSLFALLGILILSGGGFYKKWGVVPQIKNYWKIFLFEEIVFYLGLFFWSYIKSFQPDIHGLEKFMDFGFVNSILRSTYFPPKDMWMAPLSINYYYFGHLATAVLTKLSQLPSNITFNLMLATLFAFTFTLGFSLGANLWNIAYSHMLKKQNNKRSIASVFVAGLLTAAILTFGGNLHTIYTFFTPYQNDNPVPPSQLVFSPQTFPNAYWYPNATRFIYHTIHEFPIYSFVVSDLHGHVLDIPFVLLTIAVFLILFVKPSKTPTLKIENSLLLGSLAGIMYMTNAWDGLIYLGVSLCFIIFKKVMGKSTTSTAAKTLFNFIYPLLILLATFVIVSLPFSIFFKPFASQVGIICAPEFLLRMGSIGPILFERGYCQTSPLWQLLILYGFFLFWILSFFAFLFAEKKAGKLFPVDIFVACLATLGIILIILPEFVYLKDIYTTYFRANTMFKLVYQAFILLSLTSGYAVIRIFLSFEKERLHGFNRLLLFFYSLVCVALLALILLYPYFAVMSYFNNLQVFKGLNGTAYLSDISKGDMAAVAWLNKHIVGQPVVLEAQGDSYTDYERISSNTGLPTIFGWTVHEWLWRGTYSIAPTRIADVQTIYESKDINLTKYLLQKYYVQYVYIGDLERKKYVVDGAKFQQLGVLVFNYQQSAIYKIH